MFKGNETLRSPEQEPRCQRTKVRRFSAARLVDRNLRTWALMGVLLVRQDVPGCRVWRHSRCWWSSARPLLLFARWSQSSREVWCGRGRIWRLIRLESFIMALFFFKGSFVTPTKRPRQIIASDQSRGVQHSPTNHDRDACHCAIKKKFFGPRGTVWAQFFFFFLML